jgi:hypothetical protein
MRQWARRFTSINFPVSLLRINRRFRRIKVRFTVPNGVSTTSPRLTASIIESTMAFITRFRFAAAEAFGDQLVDHRGFETTCGFRPRLLFASPGPAGWF